MHRSNGNNLANSVSCEKIRQQGVTGALVFSLVVYKRPRPNVAMHRAAVGVACVSHTREIAGIYRD